MDIFCFFYQRWRRYRLNVHRRYHSAWLRQHPGKHLLSESAQISYQHKKQRTMRWLSLVVFSLHRPRRLDYAHELSLS
uniref:Uncharacterized protein n=1 Tax=Yersinia enterocolitica TaxID=630 RepID=Q84GU0_YEREN|nr:unknown [Yersinia enterocolitica]CBW54682.1 p06 in pYVa127/90 [Yersinia enterocolitica (type O:8)]